MRRRSKRRTETYMAQRPSLTTTKVFTELCTSLRRRVNLQLLYQFDQAHGTSPYAPLVQGSDGDFYGVTLAGGNLNLGVIFRMSPSGKLTVLYNFDGAHGSHPYGPLVQGNDGSFYGTTFNGGTHGSGVIFQMQPNGRLKVIHNFEGSGGGFYPCKRGLVQASDGNLYGTTHGGGAVDAGTIFKISPDGQYAVLSKFDGTDGKFPMVTRHSTLMAFCTGIPTKAEQFLRARGTAERFIAWI